MSDTKFYKKWSVFWEDLYDHLDYKYSEYPLIDEIDCVDELVTILFENWNTIIINR